MKNDISEEMLKLKNEIICGMIDYMEGDDADDDFDAGYTREDVDKCDAILADYLISVSDPALYGDSEKIMALVKDVVASLNVLNKECEHGLIETDQREGICELIINSATLAGLISSTYDITEEWREW
ncbi:hypothetical protein [Chitiniphilus eburneus]|uniref:hypothetical protein n=1 Tax=Chitiniphilus eburneus TaxID=2571148 RepID=UPI0035D11362